MNLADIAPGLHAIGDDNPSAETREHLVEKIDTFRRRTFPSEFQRFTLLLQDNAASLKGGVSGVIYCDWLRIDGLWVDDALRHRGIGTRLITCAENHAIARGCHSASHRGPVQPLSSRVPALTAAHGLPIAMMQRLERSPEYAAFL
jgi:GNAT superfamily N-acetyltransferase